MIALGRHNMSKIQRLREQLYLLQGSRCFYCDKAIPPDDRSLEHVIPSSSGGLADAENAVVVCEAANQLLGAASPKQKIIMLKAGGGKIECPKKCGHSCTSGHEHAVPTPQQKASRPGNSGNEKSNQKHGHAEQSGSQKTAQSKAEGQTPMTAKQKHKARSGHQSMPRASVGRRRG